MLAWAGVRWCGQPKFAFLQQLLTDDRPGDQPREVPGNWHMTHASHMPETWSRGFSLELPIVETCFWLFLVKMKSDFFSLCSLENIWRFNIGLTWIFFPIVENVQLAIMDQGSVTILVYHLLFVSFMRMNNHVTIKLRWSYYGLQLNRSMIIRIT